MIDKRELFSIGIGTWGIGGFAVRNQKLEIEKQIDAIAYMLNRGMNFVEANLWYSQGFSTEILAEAIKRSNKKRSELFICQAVYLKDNKLNDVEDEINRLLSLLETDHIDTLQFTQSSFIEYGFDKVCGTASKMISKGKTRFVSITNENLENLKRYHHKFKDKLFSTETCYNFEIRANEEEGIINYANDNGILNVIYQPLRRNRTANRNWPLLIELSKKYSVTQNQIIMGWLLSKKLLPLTKSENKTHIDQHLEAIYLRLEDADIKRLNQFRPPNYNPPKVDWECTGTGVKVDQLSNVFDAEYDKQRTNP